MEAVPAGSTVALAAFVRGTLGCGCPDEVFGKIESGELAAPVAGKPGRRIVVGDRLLIYIVSPESLGELAGEVCGLAVRGRCDRDRHGYNRFRLVVAADGEDALRNRLAAGFAEAAGADDRLHIHFVTPAAVVAVT